MNCDEISAKLLKLLMYYDHGKRLKGKQDEQKAKLKTTGNIIIESRIILYSKTSWDTAS